MSTEKLYEAITLIDDDLIDEAGTYTPKKRKVIQWKRWAGLAACLVLVVGVGSLFRLDLIGGNSSADLAPPTAFEDRENLGSTFMAYAGPIFPLSTLESANGLTAQRDVTLDFADWTEPTYGSNITVRDEYILTNTAAEEKTITLLYPFVSSLMDLDECTPTLMVNGTQPETDLIYGLYSGGFQGVLGADDPGGSANLHQPNSWEDYKALLSDGSYLAKAMKEYPDLTGIEVIVYEFTDPWGPEESSSIPNPSIRVTFDLDYDKTTVLTYGFHSGMFDRENRKMGRGFSIPQSFQPNYGEPFYLIILGDDVENMEVEGYVTGGWDTKQKLKEFGVDVQRHETNLDSILRKAVGYLYDNNSWQYGDNLAIDFETYYALYCDYLTTYGILAEDCKDRYDLGTLEDLSEVGSVDRICYLRAEVTLPADGTVEIAARMRKKGSYNHFSSSSKGQDTRGYDLLTVLGSTLTFTDQSAALLDHGLIEIVRQNFGFDLEADIKTVGLDPAVECYYLEVRHTEN